MIGWVPFGKQGPQEDRTADEALYAEQQAHMADAVAKLRGMALAGKRLALHFYRFVLRTGAPRAAR